MCQDTKKKIEKHLPDLKDYEYERMNDAIDLLKSLDRRLLDHPTLVLDIVEAYVVSGILDLNRIHLALNILLTADKLKRG